MSTDRASNAATETLAVIPVRGGSKGFPGKNLARLAGRPLVVHTIEAALAASSVSRIVVSTDHAELADIAGAAGAEVLHRPGELARDEASSESALLHALDHLQVTEGYEPEVVVFLQATAPIRRRNDIDDAVATLFREEADSLVSVSPTHAFLWRTGETGPGPLNYDHQERPRRQDREPEYVENGSIYVFKPWVLRQMRNRLGGKIALYLMSRWSSVDIDEPADLALCEWIIANPELLDEDGGGDHATERRP